MTQMKCSDLIFVWSH